jgi:hypothetical protein
VDRAVNEAVTGLRAEGVALSVIATELGVSRQAVWDRWGRP